MAAVEKLTEVIEAFRQKAAALQKERASVVVGYTQKYAVYVHENLETHHPVGQAKFLEQPARALRGKVHDMVETAYKKGLPMSEIMLLIGLRLQRDSQKLVPVDTGALKNSAFTRLESQ